MRFSILKAYLILSALATGATANANDGDFPATYKASYDGGGPTLIGNQIVDRTDVNIDLVRGTHPFSPNGIPIQFMSGSRSVERVAAERELPDCTKRNLYSFQRYINSYDAVSAAFSLESDIKKEVYLLGMQMDESAQKPVLEITEKIAFPYRTDYKKTHLTITESVRLTAAWRGYIRKKNTRPGEQIRWIATFLEHGEEVSLTGSLYNCTVPNSGDLNVGFQEIKKRLLSSIKKRLAKELQLK